MTDRSPRDLVVFTIALALGITGGVTLLTMCCAGGLTVLDMVRDFFS